MLGLRQTHFNVTKLPRKLQFLLSLSSLFFHLWLSIKLNWPCCQGQRLEGQHEASLGELYTLLYICAPKKK